MQDTAIKYALIVVLGATGSVCRYLLAGFAQSLTAGTFPLGTLVVNLIGCFLIGMLNTALTGPIPIRPEYRVGIVVGLLGGFTTFSSFAWETFSLAEDGQKAGAALNIVLSVVVGLAAVWTGARVTQRMVGV